MKLLVWSTYTIDEIAGVGVLTLLMKLPVWSTYTIDEIASVEYLHY